MGQENGTSIIHTTSAPIVSKKQHLDVKSFEEKLLTLAI
jgi:hypothetical protein